jgi:hypothetical protein
MQQARHRARYAFTCFLLYAFILQGFILAASVGQPEISTAERSTWAGFELCTHGGAIPPAAPSKTPVADTCCIFCVACGGYLNCGSTSASEYSNIAFTDAVWRLTVLRLDAFLVNESAWPRGPPFVA